jgi:hypothetical protein
MFDQGASEGPGSGGSSGPSGSACDSPSFDSGAFDVAALRDLAAKAAGVDVSLAGDEELMCAATALEEVRSLVDVAQGHVLARLEADGTTDRLAGHRTGTWLGHEARMSKARARSRVRGARRAREWFHAFDEAVARGELGWQHLDLLCGVANVRNREALAEAQGELIGLARRFSFEHWASLVRRLASELDEDGGYDPNEDIHANRLRFSSHGDLTAELAGRLVGSARVTVEQTLGAAADDLFDRFTRDHQADPDLEVPTRPTLLALALEEVCRRYGSVELESTRQPRTEAVVIVEQDDTPDGEPAAVLRSPDGNRLPDSAAVLLADAYLTPLVVDADGNPLRYGRSRRYATTAQRTALAVRDGGCVFPGCDMPPGHCDAHHEPGYHPDGRTDTDSMLLLCRHHHRVTHRTGWWLEADPERGQRWIWTTPTGRRIRSQRQPC